MVQAGTDRKADMRLLGRLVLHGSFRKRIFLSKSKLISFWKIKFSAGVTGNDQIGDYNYFDLYTPSLFPYLGITPYQAKQAL